MPIALPIFLRRLPGFFLLVGMVLLTACASRDKAQAPATPSPLSTPAPSIPKGAPSKSQLTPKPHPKPRPTPAVIPASTPKPQASPSPKPASPISSQPGRAQSLAALIQNGRFLRNEDGSLIFAKNQVSNDAPSSLFEDAIILGRLRSRLNQIPGLPPGISESATVKDATADLTASADLSNATCAAMIDAALATDGVALVRVRF